MEHNSLVDERSRSGYWSVGPETKLARLAYRTRDWRPEGPEEEHLERNAGPSTEEVSMITAVVERCAGIDVAKNVLNVCVMTGAAADEPAVEFRKFGAFNAELARLRDWLAAAGCTHVVMESTGC